MKDDAIADFFVETEHVVHGSYPEPLHAYTSAPAASAALAWDLLRRLQGHPSRPENNQPGSHNVDEVTVDWLVNASSPEDWDWLAANFDYRRLGWPTVSLLDALL